MKMTSLLDVVREHPFISLLAISTVASAAASAYSSHNEAEKFKAQVAQVQTANVLGKKAEETFVSVGEVRYFSKIDGVPIGDMYKKQ
jgi:hypothetical protein